jgi:hypothetical protein
MGLAFIYLALLVWLEAKRKGITNECDPFLLLRSITTGGIGVQVHDYSELPS